MKSKNTRYENLRLNSNYSQKDVAKILKVKCDTYSKWEREINDMPLDKCNELVNLYRVSFDYLLCLSDSKKIQNNINKYIDWEKLNSRMLYLRKLKGYTQEELSNKLGFAQTTYSNYENGTRKITTFKLYLIAKFYSVSFDWLVGRIN